MSGLSWVIGVIGVFDLFLISTELVVIRRKAGFSLTGASGFEVLGAGSLKLILVMSILLIDWRESESLVICSLSSSMVMLF